MLVNFLMNQADAGAAWSMLGRLHTFSAISPSELLVSDTGLGLTIRLAQSLGLHCSPTPEIIQDPAKKDQAIVKFYIW